ncbi:MAG: glycosyltransferase family 4 protein [Glaciimonas sp.]|nr:glycosyltransferase family 4 protein [Glaciimonas sp.]
MKSILLLAYQISPTRGSEYGVGWNFAINLALKNKVFLVCGASGDHMGDTKEIEEHFTNHPNSNIVIIAVKPSKLAAFINWFNKKGLTPLFYVAFMLWHRKVYTIVSELIKNENIDLIHHLNPIGFREPGYLWRLDKPFIWGPIGGAQFVNPVLMKKLPIDYKLLILIKNAATFLQLKYYWRIRHAIARTSQLVFSTEENRRNFERFFGRTGHLISEQGTFVVKAIEATGIHTSVSNLRMVWVGNVIRRKNLIFIFSALALVSPRDKWELNVIGDGPEVNFLKELASDLGISGNIVWHGRKPRSDVISLIASSDLHLLASLSEANPAVLFEAMSAGVPTISLDQNGMHSTLANGRGVLVPITTYNQTLELFASEITSFILKPQTIIDLKQKMISYIDDSSWAKKIEQFEIIYDSVLEKQ